MKNEGSDSMKKAAALMLSAALFVTPVFSETLINSTIQEYNDMTVLTGAAKISDPVITDSIDSIQYTFKLSDNLFIEMTEQENTIRFVGVICKDDAETGAFLAACANCCYLMSGVSDGYYCYTEVLDQFLQARSGSKTDVRKLPSAGIILNMTKESFGFVFAATR